MRIVIVGLGSAGQRHLSNLLELGIDDIILCRSGKATLANPDLARFPTAPNLEDALARLPDAVVIATPTNLHLEAALEAARLGCAIFVEKPLSDGCEGLDDLASLISSKRLVTQIGFQFRFHPAFAKAKEIVDSDGIGRLYALHAHWGEYLPDWHPWEDYRGSYAARADMGGGVVRTLSHPIDYLSWFGGRIDQAAARLSPLDPLGIDVEQAALISVTFANGAIGSVYVDYLQRPKAHRFEVIGGKGTLRWDEQTNRLTVSTPTPTPTKELDFGPDFERNAMFLAEMRHFLECVRSGRQTRAPIPEGIHVQRILCSCG